MDKDYAKETNYNFVRKKKLAKKNCEGIKLMFSELNSEDCPLYVPILVSKGRRDDLKQYLIDNNVYCPNHWNNEHFKIKKQHIRRRTFFGM